MDKSRAFFQIKFREKLGDRLILRFPTKHAKVLKMLREAGIGNPPNQITVGYYLQLDDPDGAWAFMPVNTDAAKAILCTPLVQNRIVEDLLGRM